MMKISTAVVSGLALLLGAGVASAQTCDNPLPLTSNNTHSGTTCGGTVGINLGGVALVHPSIVYTFVADGASGTINTSGDPTISALIANDCSSPPDYAGNSIDVSTLVDGNTYYFIVTSEELSAPNPQICGEYNVVTGNLPVELQSFSVD